MSEKELLRKFKSMSVHEQRKFLREARLMRRPIGRQRRVPRRVEWPDVEARARQIMGDRIVPNLVLLERDESAF